VIQTIQGGIIWYTSVTYAWHR